MVTLKGKIRENTATIILIFCFIFMGQADADEIVFKYQKMLVEKIKNPVIKEIEFENNAWEEAKKIALKYVNFSNVEKPVTLVIKNNRFLDSTRNLRGIYEADLNIVIATDYKVLVHEYLHAIFYLTGNTGIAEDESFIRSIYPVL